MSSFRSYHIDPNKATDNYAITFRAPSRTPKGLRHELELALAHKADSTQKPICALVSGGVDSQVMLTSLRDAGVPFHAVHLAPRYKGEHVATQCIHQCQAYGKHHGFEIEILSIDIELHKYRHMPVMNLLRYQNPYIATHCVIGLGGNIFHFGHSGIGYYDARSYIHNEAPHWVLDAYGLELDMGMYQYTPELYFSFLFHSEAEKNRSFLKHNPHLPKDSSRLLKFNILFAEYGDELMYFQKRNGLEDFPDYLTNYDERIWKLTGYDSWITFPEHDLRRLYRQEITSATHSATVNPLILRHIRPPRELLRLNHVY